MHKDVVHARWWLAYPCALVLLAIADFGLGFWRPFPARLPEQFSPAYLDMYVSDVPRDKPVIAFVGDSVLWGYKIRESDTAIRALRRQFPAAQMLNLSYEGGSPPNTAILLRYILHLGLRPAVVVANINIKEFNSFDSAYKTLHPSLERAAQQTLTKEDRATLALHAPVGFNAALNDFMERLWLLYRLRTDVREQIFGVDDMAGWLVRTEKSLSGTGASEELAHRPTADRFLTTYDLNPIDYSNVALVYYRRLLGELCSARLPAILFLTPTNHRLLHDYIDVPQYQGNLAKISAVPHCKMVTVVNLDRAVPSRYFIDNDHLNPDGQRMLARLLAPYLRGAIR